MSQYNAGQVAAYFDEYGIHEWERLVSTPVEEVKLHVHTHYLQGYLAPGMRVLEIGAGAGRFTQVLAGLGCTVLVGDISQGQLDLNRQHAEQFGFAHAVEAWRRLDICDLGALAGEAFDAVVCYGGPLSYVFEQRAARIGRVCPGDQVWRADPVERDVVVGLGACVAARHPAVAGRP